MQATATATPLKGLVRPKEFAAGLAAIAPFAAPFLGKFEPRIAQMTADHHGLTLEAFNLDWRCGARYTLPAEVEDSGQQVFAVADVASVVRQLTDRDLCLVGGPYGDFLGLTTDGAACTFEAPKKTLPPWPLPQTDASAIIALNSVTIRRMLRRTASFADDGRLDKAYLRCVEFSLSPGMLRATATNGVRVAQVRQPVEYDGPEVTGLIPARALTRLPWAAAAPDVQLAYWAEGTDRRSAMQVSTGQIALASERWSQEYPDVGRLFPTKYDLVVTMETERLLRATRKALVVSQERRLRFSVRADSVELEGEMPGRGQIRTWLPADVTGPDMVLGFDGALLVDALRSMESEEVRMEFAKPQHPVRLTPVGDDTYMHVVLPLIGF